jgi:uncharacterized protein YodC (DUF2158 family)
MSEKLQVGDKVQLASGSDVMTVEAIHADGLVNCVWQFHGIGFVREAFPAAALRLVEPPAARTPILRR